MTIHFAANFQNPSSGEKGYLLSCDSAVFNSMTLEPAGWIEKGFVGKSYVCLNMGFIVSQANAEDWKEEPHQHVLTPSSQAHVPEESSLFHGANKRFLSHVFEDIEPGKHYRKVLDYGHMLCGVESVARSGQGYIFMVAQRTHDSARLFSVTNYEEANLNTAVEMHRINFKSDDKAQLAWFGGPGIQAIPYLKLGQTEYELGTLEDAIKYNTMLFTEPAGLELMASNKEYKPGSIQRYVVSNLRCEKLPDL